MVASIGKPGIGTTKTAAYRRVLASEQGKLLLPPGKTIDGSESRDPLNTGYLHTLRCGMLLGEITSTGLYAPSVLGVTSAAYDGVGTTLTVSAATATEINRRIGSSGTFYLTGPDAAAGTVRTMTVTYSAINTTTGEITITALFTDGVSAVNEVQTLAFTDGGSGAGTFTITFDGDTTAAITYSSTAATLKTNIQAALDAVWGTNAIVVGGSAVTAITLTFSGGEFAGQALALATVADDNLTDLTVAVTETTAGVAAVTEDSGDFISGALVRPTDGSGTPLCILGIPEGLRVTDEDGDDIDVQCAELLVGGMIDASQILNYPSDSSLKSWVKSQLNAVGQFVFDDDFTS